MASSSTPDLIASLHAERERERVESEELHAKHLADPETQAWAEAYLDYAKSVQLGNEQHGTNYNPHPYSNCQHETCVLCAETITDDPYGHNPAPFRDDYPSGHCCSACNSKFVVPMRVMLMTAKTGEKAKVKKTMKGLNDFFAARVPAPSREEVLQKVTMFAVTKHVGRITKVAERPEGISRRMFHQEIVDDIVRTLNRMGYADAEGWCVYKGDGKFDLAVRVEGLQTFMSLKDETTDE
jgi:hypothetical protein